MTKALAVGVLVGLAGLIVCACGPTTVTNVPVTPSPTGSTTGAPEVTSTASTTGPASATGTTGTTSTTTVPTVTCQSAQLEASFEGGQGATGNWTATFWIADASAIPCALRSSVTVDLLDGSGMVRMSASRNLTTPISLGAHGVIPSGTVVVQPGQSFGLAFVTLFWPTTPNLAGSVDGRCPRPIFVPSSVRISSGGLAQVVVDHPEFEGRTIVICPSDIWVEAAGAF